MGTSFKEVDLMPTDLQFSVLSSNEIRELSVVEVITALTFDLLGRPFPGGLYDPLMGSFGKSMDPCGTCLSLSYCPGHCGHINLYALVYNPFFIKNVHTILSISCLDCHMLQISNHVQTILDLQLKLVDNGYVVEAQDLEIFKSVFISESSDEPMVKMEDGTTVHPKIAEMYELLKKGVVNRCNNTKTTCAIRQSIVSATLSKPTSKKCIHCKKLLKKVTYSYKKLMLSYPKEDQNKKEKTRKSKTNKVILADECRNYLRNIYDNYKDFLQEVFPIFKLTNLIEYPVDIFFMDCIAVTPPKARPSNVMHDRIVEHPQTGVYRNIIETNGVLKSIFKYIKSSDETMSEEQTKVFESAKGGTALEKMYFAWQDLQTAIDLLLDENLKGKVRADGLKQVLEKKEGLIRKHMMGKRVNFAARTVITPDPNISVDEVGIPDIFARKLSYPVPVSSRNVVELRKMVRNGPDIHPGANYIEDEKGYKTLIPANNPDKRESMAKLLLTNPENGIKVVHRHILNGDVLLLNRQPTLHRPSIMGHKVRILQGEKTFRLHYSNCKSYNADFDGDEMNAHFPQNEIARSEAYNLANVANQYLVPKDGSPLGGLIQDQVISGVKLSVRGRFFNRDDYQQLVFQGLSNMKGKIKLLPPAIIKPKMLWSGKQVLSTIIINLTPEGYDPITLSSVAKISHKTWNVERKHETIYGGTELNEIQMSESEVIIRKGELLSGVLDKQQYGATCYGLIHCVYELYGGDCSTRLLTSFTKVFTYFLQREGFTLGVHDILVTPEAEKTRREIIRESRTIGNTVVASALEMNEVPEADTITEKMSEAYMKDPKFRIILDRKYKSILDGFTNEINQTCLPGGLICKFPSNNLQLMVLSGAKGSMVNTMQISCLLGQIELEGKRPPLMISGKSLPSFSTFETSPKSGGFIDGRFMTGIQPQDFFFHCMAGREGLIDTAVKTSRSGYLQRCLIKHLEGLTVNYDLTVRDSDKSVIQFLYGEDGLDILKSQFFNMKCLEFLDQNASVILKSNPIDKIRDEDDLAIINKCLKKLKSWRKKHGDPTEKRRSSSFQQFSLELRNEIETKNPKKLNTTTGRLNIDQKIITLWTKADEEEKAKYRKKNARCPDPIISNYKPDNVYGSMSEYLESLIQLYNNKHLDRQTNIKDIMCLKHLNSLAEPGEPVGLLAAQSIGEPSTQMTLNTFHFAGRGEMNVTLGIPRLREILMLASANIKTPSMDIPFKPNQIKNAEKLRIKLNRVTLADVLQMVKVNIRLVLRPTRGYEYTLHFMFLPREAYESDFCIKPKHIIKYLSTTFFKLLFRAIDRISKKNNYSKIDLDDGNSNDMDNGKSNLNLENDDDDFLLTEKPRKTIAVDDSSDDDEGTNENDAADIKLKSRKLDEQDYDDPEEEEELLDANEEDGENENVDLDKTIADNSEDEEIFISVKDCQMYKDYVYDKEKYLWSKLTFELPMRYKRPDISTILKELASKAIVYQVPKIKRAITYTSNDKLLLKTDGINIVEMFKYNKLLDLNKLYSNDIHEIAKTYGIEAASRVIVKEVQNVFKVYGITVNPRHLLLIADYMTCEGSYKPLSRKGLEFSSSPLQQMSFESCMQFLKSATMAGRPDELNSPSGRLMVGLPVEQGTGCFSVMSKIC